MEKTNKIDQLIKQVETMIANQSSNITPTLNVLKSEIYGEINVMKEKINALSKVNDEIHEMKKDISELRSIYTKLEAEMKTLSKVLEIYKNQSDRKENEMYEFDKEFVKTVNEFVSLQKDVESISNTVTNLNEKINSVVSANSILEKRMVKRGIMNRLGSIISMLSKNFWGNLLLAIAFIMILSIFVGFDNARAILEWLSKLFG